MPAREGGSGAPSTPVGSSLVEKGPSGADAVTAGSEGAEPAGSFLLESTLPEETEEIPSSSQEILQEEPRIETRRLTLETAHLVPLAEMGESIPRSPLEGSPGYAAPNDPELEAVVRGRRLVDPHDIPLAGAAGSPEELAWAILEGLSLGDRKGLWSLMVTYDEYLTILWPEFPESRPITNIEAKYAWFFHERTTTSGISSGISLHGEKVLTLEKVVCAGGRAPYTNFTLYHGIEIHARTLDHEPVIIQCASAFVERLGGWKVYLYKD